MSRVRVMKMGAASLAAAWLAAAPAVRAEGNDGDDRRVRVIRLGGGGHLGVRLEDVDREDVAKLKLSEERGALVQGVETGTAAEKAGIKEGDVVLRYQGEPVQSAAHLARLVRETPPGRTVSVEVSRAGSPQKLQVTLEEGSGRRFRFDGDVEVPMPPIPPLPPAAFKWGDWGKEHRKLSMLEGWRGPRKLGIEYQEISGQLAKYFRVSEEKGLLVASVEEGGPAAQGGMKAGDVLLKFAGKAVQDADDLREAVAEAEGGQEVTVTVQRDGKPLELKVKLRGSEGRRRPSGSTT